MASKDELIQENELLKAHITRLEHDLAILRASMAASARHNSFHYELACLLLEKPRSIQELAEHFNREARLISQWIFQLKTKRGAKIITLSDGKKSLLEQCF